MTGFPQEEDNDVLMIGDFLESMAKIFKSEKGNYPKIQANLACFIPKPFTEFENVNLLDKDSYLRRKNLITRRLARLKFIKLVFSEYSRTLIEYLLSRGNRNSLDLLTL